jgi:murein DD-endopeptidase MepM/ murein hydrolase activator NlpD
VYGVKRVISVGRFVTLLAVGIVCGARASPSPQTLFYLPNKVLDTASPTATTPAKTDNPYIWPLKGRYALTSTFAEYRRGHFHAGIDVSTGGRTGVPVQAAAAGHVVRVRVSPFGYGKALYIEHHDGTHAVYAHLKEFSPAINALVSRKQQAVGQYEVDIYPHRNAYPVAQGDVIGFSGRSGCEAPHLHFELRDKFNRPINPLAHGLSVPDRVAPRFVALCLYPVGPRSAINGERHPHVVHLERVGRRNLYRAPTRIRVHGSFSVSAYVRDEQASRSYPLGPYRLETFLDEVPVFATRMERFSYERSHDVEVAFDHRLITCGTGKFLRQFALAGHPLEIHRTGTSADGTIDASDWDESNGTCSRIVRFVAHDASGNRSEAMLEVFRDDAPVVSNVIAFIQRSEARLEAAAEDPDGTVTKVHFKIWEEGTGVIASTPSTFVEQGRFVGSTQLPDSTASSDLVVEAVAEDDDGVISKPAFALVGLGRDGSSGAPTLSLDGQWYDDRLLLMLESDRFLKSAPVLTAVWGDSLPVPLHSTLQTPSTAACWYTPELDTHGTLQVAARAYDFRGRVAETAWSADVHAIRRTTGGTVKCGNALSIHFPRSGVYRPILVRVEPTDDTVHADIPFITQAYRIEPADEPLDKRATITFSLEEEPSMRRAGIYALNSNGEWGYLATQPDENAKLVTASIRELGTYAVLRDTVAPRIWAVRPRNGSTVRNSKPTIAAHVDDTGSGIAYKTITVHLDDDLIICEYDPFENSISHRPDTNLADGKHTLSISISDYAGNTSRTTTTFMVQ